ncbi:universal stress protein [Rothia nasimurium]|uniref:universal stress protein n=1 Tax=Rothia nasimurium TaxID=85336 RepID=UPI001629040B|nr:universal stress protein [Rothia nasimurium]
MRYVVGYSPSPRGRDALNLAVALASSLGAELDVVYVLKQQNPRLAAPRSNFGAMLQEQAVGWLEEAQQWVPTSLKARFHLRQAESTAAGLMEFAGAIGAGAIIVGGAKTGGWLFHSIGSVGNALLHRASVPVILAPHNYDAETHITQIDCAVSPDIDSIGLVEEAVATCNRTDLAVRLVSLIEDVATDGFAAREAEEGVRDLLEQSSLAPERPDLITVAVGHGASVPDAVESVNWSAGSVLMAGSSKLAQRGELFLSSNTAKILTRLPIPLVVVPRDYSPGRRGSAQEPWTGSIPVVGR